MKAKMELIICDAFVHNILETGDIVSFSKTLNFSVFYKMNILQCLLVWIIFIFTKTVANFITIDGAYTGTNKLSNITCNSNEDCYILCESQLCSFIPIYCPPNYACTIHCMYDTSHTSGATCTKSNIIALNSTSLNVFCTTAYLSTSTCNLLNIVNHQPRIIPLYQLRAAVPHPLQLLFLQ